MILELRDICKTYDQGRLEVPVLKNVSLSVEEGEYLAIMGPSGSGKTTLMNIIGCLDVPSSGEYYLEGEELSGQTDSMLSQVRLRSIGFVFQSFFLLPRQSAVENVALPLLYAGVKRKKRLEIAAQALERVGLGDRLNFKPTQLSGGQCQRVAIARAMVNSPKLLLADEPTGALDTASGEQIMELFQSLNDEGVTIVMITHEADIAAHAKRVLHIRDGQLVADAGTPAPRPVPVPQQTETAAVPAAQAPAIVEPDEPRHPLEEPLVDEPTLLAAPLRPRIISPVEIGPAAFSPAPQEDVLDIESIAVDDEETDMPAEEPSLEAPAVETEFSDETPPAEEDIETPVTEESPAEEEGLGFAIDIESIFVEEDEPEEPIGGEEIPAAPEAPLEKEISVEAQEPAPAAAVAESEKPTAAEIPALISRATKLGAPEQISFDIWEEPEAVDIEAAVSEIERLDEGPDEAQTAEEQLELAESEPVGAAPEETAPEAPQAGDREDEGLDIESIVIEEGRFGAAKKTEIDLEDLFGAKEPPETGQPPKLVEMPDGLFPKGGDDA